MNKKILVTLSIVTALSLSGCVSVQEQAERDQMAAYAAKLKADKERNEKQLAQEKQTKEMLATLPLNKDFLLNTSLNEVKNRCEWVLSTITERWPDERKECFGQTFKYGHFSKIQENDLNKLIVLNYLSHIEKEGTEEEKAKISKIYELNRPFYYNPIEQHFGREIYKDKELSNKINSWVNSYYKKVEKVIQAIEQERQRLDNIACVTSIFPEEIAEYGSGRFTGEQLEQWYLRKVAEQKAKKMITDMKAEVSALQNVSNSEIPKSSIADQIKKISDGRMK